MVGVIGSLTSLYQHQFKKEMLTFSVRLGGYLAIQDAISWPACAGLMHWLDIRQYRFAFGMLVARLYVAGPLGGLGSRCGQLIDLVFGTERARDAEIMDHGTCGLSTQGFTQIRGE